MSKPSGAGSRGRARGPHRSDVQVHAEKIRTVVRFSLKRSTVAAANYWSHVYLWEPESWRMVRHARRGDVRVRVPVPLRPFSPTTREP